MPTPNPPPENLPDPWLFDTEALLRELDRCRKTVLQIPITNPNAIHFGIQLAVSAIWNLTENLRYLLHLHREQPSGTLLQLSSSFSLDQSGRSNVASRQRRLGYRGVPRIIAIAVLNGFGMHAFDDLPVVRFAVDERDKGLLTPQYSFALAQNFRPERDYQANIRAIKQTLRVLVGQNDDVSYADRFAAVFKTAGKDVPVTVLPGIDHISLTLDPVAVQAAIAAVESMDHEKPNQSMKPTAPSRSKFSVLATTPCRGLSPSR